ncbi:MAG TPA: AbrB/MazE/SpoVT family DNA-binding domain-containing protein [Cyanobacteria bacterium UBA11369]|nr:AbrB/MazE/SpoVT family DNA-binding domain-containing protein [Cyanobacteria bacterium UBA11369]
MLNPCHVSLLSDGQHQVLKIPHQFALPGTEVLLRKEGNRLIIEPIRPGSLVSLLATLEEITENFPDVDEGLMLLDDITL